ncbi:MAG: ATP-binding cassette domain-containing protein [Oceanivirga sp.]|nr:ATP-binding cassette domain-containing protein [Oceanivirga sp.]
MNLINIPKGLVFNNSITYPEIQLNKQDFLYIQGKSGAGKTSLLKLLNRTAIATKGDIYYMNKNILEYPVTEYRKNVLLVPQDIFLFDISIKENFNMFYQNLEKEFLSDNEIIKYLEICCLDIDINKNVKLLSGGERKRVFLSIFLSLTKSILLLDEPITGLDEKTAIKLLGNIKKLGFTIICVSHNKEIIEKFATRSIKL